LALQFLNANQCMTLRIPPSSN